MMSARERPTRPIGIRSTVSGGRRSSDVGRSSVNQGRARYSTHRPAGSVSSPSGSVRRAGRTPNPPLALTVNQWTVLVCLGAVMFIGLALAGGVVVGRILRGSLSGPRLADVPIRQVVTAEVRPVSANGAARIDPRFGSSTPDTGVSLLLSDALPAGGKAPAFRLEAVDGSPVSLEALRGRTLLINFWATWCTWCKYELPALQAVYEAYHDKGLVVVGVNVEEPRSLVEAYVRRYGISFPVVLDVEGRTADAYRVRGLPMTYFVQPDGTIIYVQRGAMREDELEFLVRRVLPEE